jgi:hypothetical protein
MKIFMGALIWGGAVIVAYVTIAVLLAAWTVLKHREEAYKVRYEEFIQAKQRVQQKLKGSENNGK